MSRSVVRGLVIVVTGLAVALVTGCTSTPSPAPAPHPLRLEASVTQYRFDEGTRTLKAGVSNNGDGDIRVTRATIDWPALAFPTVRLPGEAIHPGQTAAFSIAFGSPRCTAPSTRPVLVATVNGSSRRLPLHVEDPGLLVRLQAKACAQQRLSRTADVRLRLATRTEQIDGEEYLPGDIVVRHRPGATGRVRIVDLSGSVLLELVPRGGRRALPGELEANRPSTAFPVLFGSAHRCDAHALGQSSQTFLVSAYVQLEHRPVQRVVLPLDTRERDRLMGVIHRDCR
jgi:autotransporter translocation and assembly factor TamB